MNPVYTAIEKNREKKDETNFWRVVESVDFKGQLARPPYGTAFTRRYCQFVI